MAEYIDKPEVIAVILSQKIEYPRTRREQGFNDALDKAVESIVCQAHTADVAPVVHAHWAGSARQVCSACGKLIHGNGWYGEDKYCARCGAKMDEEVKP